MWLSVLLVVCVVVSGGRGQDEVTKPRIYSLHVQSEVQFRFATTLITSKMANPNNHSTEAVFNVILPNEAFISNFTMEIDGVVYPGDVKEKNQAKRDYQRAKKRGQSAGHVSKKPRDTNKFKVEVNVAALSKVTFNLTYQELLKRTRGVYQHTIYVNPGQPVEDLQIDVAIQESREITTLRVPPIRTDILTNDHTLGENAIAIVSRPSPKRAVIRYVPTVEQQLTESDVGISGQFVVEYDLQRSLDAGDLLVVNGYFVHFFAPKVSDPIPKDVLFILDVSSSMASTKLEQLKAAMYIILDDLKEGDRFNILKFSSKTKLYRSKMIAATPDNVMQAKEHVRGLVASGWTNINSALLKSINHVKKFDIDDEERAPIIIFLTDGAATTGETGSVNILANVRAENEGAIPVFGLAFGKGADWDLVNKVSLQNHGVARKIYEDSDADLQIAGFYDELAVTLLNNVSVEYLSDTVQRESLTKSSFNNYFQGSELVVAGKLDDLTSNVVDLRIFGDGATGGVVLNLDSSDEEIDFGETPERAKFQDFEKITEKTWAYLTIKQLLRRADGEINATVVQELKKQALDLSLQYGFVTPLTSMVVTKPEGDDEADDDSKKAKKTPTRNPNSSGRRGRGGRGGGRSYGGGGGGDPHYMIRIRGLEHPICFDVRSKDGEIYNILTDPRRGVEVNVAVVKASTLDKYGEPKTFIGEVAVKTKRHILVVTPSAIIYDKQVFTWDEERVKHFGNNEFLLTDHGHMISVRFGFGPEILIKRHGRNANETEKVDYLNIYIKHEDGFSKQTTGLIGQFVNGHKHITMKKEFVNNGGKTIAKFQVKEGHKKTVDESHNSISKPSRRAVRAQLIERSEVVEKGSELCWMVHRKFEEVLYGEYKHYILKDLL